MIKQALNNLSLLLAIAAPSMARASDASAELLREYRDLVFDIRTSNGFVIPMPGNQHMPFSYALKLGEPKWNVPISMVLPDFNPDENGKEGFYVQFFDKIFALDDSYIDVAGEQLPLTCIHVNGQDNRGSATARSPLFPKLVLQVYLVANDFTCDGPIRKGWPEVGGKKEAWDTYVYFEIHDPTIMLPKEVKLRYRSNEYHAVVVDKPDAPTQPSPPDDGPQPVPPQPDEPGDGDHGDHS